MNAIPFHRFIIPCLSALLLTFPAYAAQEKKSGRRHLRGEHRDHHATLER